MIKDRDALENGPEPQPPQGLWHCREHKLLVPVAYNDEHFQEEHYGKHKSQLRSKCKGSRCDRCKLLRDHDEYNLFKTFTK